MAKLAPRTVMVIRPEEKSMAVGFAGTPVNPLSKRKTWKINT